ncbi:MAG: alpha-galactosidase [Clostridiales bacterium]|nr:alpha-galactosidase [Clostridiales bacterium]
MISFDLEEKIFRIDTRNTTYAFKIAHEKFLAHLYYGKKTDSLQGFYREYPVDFAPYIEEIGANFSLDTIPTELSFFDSGDTKDTAIKIKNKNGDSSTLFYYKEHKIFKGRLEFENMPYSRLANETLEIIYEDETSGVELHSYYSVFENSDTITRYLKFVNKGQNKVQILQATGCQLDLSGADYTLVTLCGEYGKERNITEYPLHVGLQGIYSKRGHSSHQFNPFMAIKTSKTTENTGEAYGLEFVYSGDFEARAEMTYDKRVRLTMGLNRDTFTWNLQAGEEFITPEVIMTYSSEGLNKLSQNFHSHIREHIINPKFVYQKRPIVINTWEAMYFNIDEEILLRYAEKAKQLGIDTVVIDDGWFGKRNDDSIGLGDWYVNQEKFKNGLADFSEKIHALGLKLGIWIEPEMVNPKSELYKAHPEWVLQCKDRPCSLGRRQLVLDLTNDEVIEYIVEQIKTTLSEVKLEYIKWDFNRTLCEVGSLSLPKERQGEAKHRFTLGSYKMHKKLTEAFPNVLFEGCSGGGGRFDAGILFYCPQIWTSDNTDPVCRLAIQKGTSMAYPLSTISAHVSDSLWNKLESTPDYNFRFNVALGGVLGYEMNITRLSCDNEKKVTEQIKQYEKFAPLILSGDVYRLDNLEDGEYGFVCVAKDKSEFLLVYQNLNGSTKKRVPIVSIDNRSIYKDDKGNIYRGEKLLKEGIEIVTTSGTYSYLHCFCEKK